MKRRACFVWIAAVQGQVQTTLTAVSAHARKRNCPQVTAIVHTASLTACIGNTVVLHECDSSREKQDEPRPRRLHALVAANRNSAEH